MNEEEVGNDESAPNTQYGIGNKEAGPCLTSYLQFDENLLAVITETKDKKYVIYNNDKRLHLQSEPTIGQIQIYPSKYKNGNPSILVNKGTNTLIDKVKNAIAVKADEPIGFYSKENSEVIYPFLDTVFNSNKEKCVNAVEQGQAKLIPVADLDKKICSFTAILKVGPLKRSKQTDELAWGFTATELIICDVPVDYTYCKVLSEPKLKFAKGN